MKRLFFSVLVVTGILTMAVGNFDVAHATTCAEAKLSCLDLAAADTTCDDACQTEEEKWCSDEYVDCQEKANPTPTSGGSASTPTSGGASAGGSSAGASSGKYGLSETAKAAELPNQDKDVPGMIGMVVKAMLGLVATVFFALMVYGGFLWMTARGESEQVNSAKKLIVNAVLGIVLISAAYAITQYVIDAVI